jgi:hypothetical protein
MSCISLLCPIWNPWSLPKDTIGCAIIRFLRTVPYNWRNGYGMQVGNPNVIAMDVPVFLLAGQISYVMSGLCVYFHLFTYVLINNIYAGFSNQTNKG